MLMVSTVSQKYGSVCMHVSDCVSLDFGNWSGLGRLWPADRSPLFLIFSTGVFGAHLWVKLVKSYIPRFAHFGTDCMMITKRNMQTMSTNPAYSILYSYRAFRIYLVGLMEIMLFGETHLCKVLGLSWLGLIQQFVVRQWNV